MSVCSYCGNGGVDLWVVNPEGGYNRPEFLCCIACLRVPPCDGLVERLLEAYSPEDAAALQVALFPKEPR